MTYNFKQIEQKWQKKWEQKKIFEVKESSHPPTQGKKKSLSKKIKKKFYVLDMFPYPSGAGLHIGHAFVFSLGDIFARFKRLQGYNVLYPIGYDSLGLPAENAAIRAGTHPKEYTKKSIANFMKQQKAMGWSYDWSRVLKTSDPEFYKWDQWIFLKLLEKGLAYKKKSAVNWCPKCKTVLANEQVHNGKCEYHGDIDVEIKHLNQWFFKITNYAEELLKGLEKIDWPDRAKKLQRNWIGKSHGTEINFDISTKLNFVLLHGYTAKAKGGFRPWLKKELESRGQEVFVPNLPTTDNPLVKEQADYVLGNYKFDENTVLLGHSLGSVVALKVVEQLKKPIKKLILASAFSNPNFKKQIGFEKGFDWKFDFERIKSNVEEIVILKDVSDKGISDEQTEELLSKLNCKIIKFTAEIPHIRGKQEPEVLNVCLEKWPIFTTRPDTIYGVTFMVVSAQHEKLMDLITVDQEKEVEKFLKKLKSVSEKELNFKALKSVPPSTKNKDLSEEGNKEGVFTGSYAVNPINGEKIPVYAGNFVLADYGCGMVMAVPAHDQRDFEFAKKYKLKIKQVISGGDVKQRAYKGEGKLINSGKFNGVNSKDAIEKITKYLKEKKLGKKVVNFKLRDWLVSRQRYWGAPIPIVYCDKCGAVPVAEKDLPVKLPDKVKFGKGNPLETNESWIKTKCPKCKGNARRETDTMDTFVNSSWYFLRYCDPKNNKSIFGKKKVNSWCPVDQYIGGPEHITMHLIYARFYTKFLRDIGLLKFDEPALRYFTQGIVKASDGEKMSKSKGNVVEPLEIIEKYGADSLRLYLVSNSSPDNDFDWNDKGMVSSFKFVKKVYDYFSGIKFGKSSVKVESKLNKTIKQVTEDVENFKHNLAVIKLRQLFESFDEVVDKKTSESFLKMLHIYCPYVTEELWNKIGNKSFIDFAGWPKPDLKKINEKLEKEEDAVSKLIGDIEKIKKLIGKAEHHKGVPRKSKILLGAKIYVYVLPKELDVYKDVKGINLFAVNDKNKHDPENKSKKVKPGRPGIYLE